MATTYKDIKAQIADLEKKAIEARKAEIANVVSDCKSKIKEYDLTPADLFPASALGAKPVKTKTDKPVSPAKFMDPKTGNTWTGKGKPPKWIAGAKSRDGFLIATVEKTLAEKAATKAGKAAGKTLATKPAAKVAAKVVAKTGTTAKKVAAKPAAKKPAAKVVAKSAAAAAPSAPAAAPEAVAAPVAGE